MYVYILPKIANIRTYKDFPEQERSKRPLQAYMTPVLWRHIRYFSFGWNLTIRFWQQPHLWAAEGVYVSTGGWQRGQNLHNLRVKAASVSITVLSHVNKPKYQEEEKEMFQQVSENYLDTHMLANV